MLWGLCEGVSQKDTYMRIQMSQLYLFKRKNLLRIFNFWQRLNFVPTGQQHYENKSYEPTFDQILSARRYKCTFISSNS